MVEVGVEGSVEVRALSVGFVPTPVQDEAARLVLGGKVAKERNERSCEVVLRVCEDRSVVVERQPSTDAGRDAAARILGEFIRSGHRVGAIRPLRLGTGERHRTEQVYDDEMAPLVSEIIQIATRERVPLLLSVGMLNPEGGPAGCTSLILHGPELGLPELRGMENRFGLANGVIRGHGGFDTAAGMMITRYHPPEGETDEQARERLGAEMAARREGAAALSRSEAEVGLAVVAGLVRAARNGTDGLPPVAPEVGRDLTRGEMDVLAERERQRRKHGDRHDSGHHGNGDLVSAAVVLATGADQAEDIRGVEWALDLYDRTPDDRTRLVMAAALLVAEIDRLDRLAEARAVPVAPPSGDTFASGGVVDPATGGQPEPGQPVEIRLGLNSTEWAPGVVRSVYGLGADAYVAVAVPADEAGHCLRSAPVDGGHWRPLDASGGPPIYLVHPNGRREERTAMTFANAQKTVGGYVEAHRLASGWYALLNEDGRPRGLSANPRATAEVQALNGGDRLGPVVLVGTVVLVPPGRADDVLGRRE